MDQAAAPVLSLTCPKCRVSFPSALRVDRPTFEAMRVAPMIERCPSCRHVSRYEARDYFFAEPNEDTDPN